MTQTAIPCLFMRGGTSRGPYIKASDLPGDREVLAGVLAAMVGAGHKLNIDGIGGGAAVTTKVAMLSPSGDDWADVDYFFAQVNPESGDVDFAPTCGNILSGVGPAAIDLGIIAAQGSETPVRIRSVNTGARVEAVVQTSAGRAVYDGDTVIAGVPGSAAPVILKFMDVTASRTSAMFPSGARRERIEGVEVTLIDVAMPMCIARAVDFGIRGDETAAALDENRELFANIERIRLEAGRRMGLGDVRKSVVPKFGLLAPPVAGGSILARYFMPWNCHPSMAVTGAICIGSCLLASGTIAEGLGEAGILGAEEARRIRIEHPMGLIDVVYDYAQDEASFSLNSAGILRTARALMRGDVYIPAAVWGGLK
mgnify:CR=1 FL=1